MLSASGPSRCSVSKRGPTPKRAWEPLARAVPIRNPEAARLAAEMGMDEVPEMWMNDRYVVTVYRF